jgi:hypothetical protein
MPKAKKNVKLRDQKPLKDPKGGAHHHRHAKNKISSGGRDPDSGTGGLLP